jgi:hypothetical protein
VDVTVASGDVKHATFAMGEGGLIEGTVLASGKRVEVGTIQVYREDAESIFEVLEQKDLYYPLTARPPGLDYWMPLPPGRYLVSAWSMKDTWSDSFGYASQFYSDRYDLVLADVVTVPGAGQRVRVDFNLVRGARASGTVWMTGAGDPAGAPGIRVRFIDAVTHERISETRTSWGSPEYPVGTYSLAVPAGDYHIWFAPSSVWPFFPSGYYTGAGDPLTKDVSVAQVIPLNDLDEVSFDLTFQSRPITIGDLSLNGMVGFEDLFLLGACWHEEPVSSDSAILGDLNEDGRIAEEDLARLLLMLRW